jgi:ribosomal protein RSM22 (predicted rRNA methylase)
MTALAYILPAALEGAIEEVLGPLSLKTLAPEVALLSAYFTSERADRPRHYLESPSHRAAYIAYFLRANFHKLEAVLEEMRPLVEAQIRKRRRFRVLDIGAGPGTMTLAAMNYLHNSEDLGPLYFLATDSNASMLHECRRLFAAFRGRIGWSNEEAVLETRTVTLEKLICGLLPHHAEGKNFDLIVLGNVWNEVMEAHPLSLKDQRACVEKLAGALDPGGALIFIEPALKETSRGLHRLHDEVLQSLPHLTVFAPCVHQQA